MTTRKRAGLGATDKQQLVRVLKKHGPITSCDDNAGKMPALHARGDFARYNDGAAIARWIQHGA